MAPVKISIGNNVLIGPYTLFNTGSHLYASRSTLIDEQGHKYGEIIVEDDVWIGVVMRVFFPGLGFQREQL